MSQSGGCLCGAIRYTLSAAPKETGACHCEMCRKWSGGVYLGVEVPGDGITVEGVEHMGVYTSSPWAERCFCKTCGSSLFYRITSPGPHQNTHHIGLGSLDDPSEINLTGEVFIDQKPAGYSFAQETEKLTGAELMALFAPPG